MKCPKCGYTSFDHNDSCPKCRRDVATERHRLNLPSFTPNPPYLLGHLSGEVGVKKIGLETEQMAPRSILGPDAHSGPEDSQALQAMEMAFEAEHGTQISLEASPMEAPTGPPPVEPTQDLDLEEDLEEIDLTDLSLDDLDLPAPLTAESMPPESEPAIEFLSDAPASESDGSEDLESDLLFGEDEASLAEALDRIPDHASGAVFLDEETELAKEPEGPLDLDQLASMVESINEDAVPEAGGRKQPLDPSLGIRHMMEDEFPDLDVTLGSRSKGK